MKNATKHADHLRSAMKKLLREFKVEPRQPLEPARAIVSAVFAYDASDAQLADALAVIDREFIDLNELRVATELELQELIGGKYPRIEQRCATLRATLNWIFEREGLLGFDRIAGLNRKELRQYFREIPELPPYVEAYTLLYAFDIPTFPCDDAALAWLKSVNAVEPESTHEAAQKFVETQLRGNEAPELFLALRASAAEGRKRK